MARAAMRDAAWLRAALPSQTLLAAAIPSRGAGRRCLDGAAGSALVWCHGLFGRRDAASCAPQRCASQCCGAPRHFSTSPVSAATTDGAGVSSVYTPTKTRRTGLVATKKGMMTYFDEWGQQIAVTVLKVESNHVIDLVPRGDGKHTLVQIGAVNETRRRIKRSRRRIFQRVGVAPKRVFAGFSVTNDAIPPVGTELTAAHFVAGQYVDVKGRSKGKGTQGVMKRWGFKGLPASHGVSLKHRSGGSIGANQDPGRVWKGKKMAGKMGNKSSVALSLKVIKIDNHLNVLYVKGAVPGSKNKVVKIRDAIRKTWRGECFPAGATVPVPTASAGARRIREVLAPQKVGRDPLLVKEE
ncbi:translation protein [Hyaloraphidium curvatum]|nr:translation protein [Hyaloraphidium curvatum]